MSIESLAQYFSAIKDPRCSGKVEHRLLDVLVNAGTERLLHQLHP